MVPRRHPSPRLSFTVDLRDTARHLFTVTVRMPPLGAENGVFEFAAAAPLDIRLLEPSQGRQGLRELILDLARTYGKHRAFPEDALSDAIVALTSPEVRDFFARYVYGAERPPLKEYYAKLGITLVEGDAGAPVRFDIDPTPTAEQLALRQAWMGSKARMN